MSKRKKLLILGICLSVVVIITAAICAVIIYNKPEEILFGPYIPFDVEDFLSGK